MSYYGLEGLEGRAQAGSGRVQSFAAVLCWGTSSCVGTDDTMSGSACAQYSLAEPLSSRYLSNRCLKDLALPLLQILVRQWLESHRMRLQQSQTATGSLPGRSCHA